MATSYTNLWRLGVMTPLDPSVKNSWGTVQSTTVPLIEQGAVGIVSVNIAGLTTWALTAANNASDQARYLVQNYTGALSGACTVTVPNVAKVGWAQNSTTGGFNVILTTGAGTTATIPPDGLRYFYSVDGSTNVSITKIGSVIGAGAFTTLTASGPITTPSIVYGLGFTASGSSIFAGDLTVAGSVSLNGVGTGLAVANNARVGNGLTVIGGVEIFNTGIALNCPNGAIVAQIIESTGGISLSVSGWDYDGGGGFALTPQPVSVGVTCNSSMLAGAYIALSDGRLKSSVEEITAEKAAAFISSAKPVTYIKYGAPEAGFIAQDQVRAGYGRYVSVIEKEGVPERVDPDGFVSLANREMGLNYNNYIAYLTANAKGISAKLSQTMALLDVALARIEALEKAR